MTEQQIEKASQQFSQYLKNIGMHGSSKKKGVVLRVFLLTTKPITVLDLVYLVKKEDIGISYHTVYQTLNRLLACGLATKIQSEGAVQFTHALSECRHSHCVCQECGAVIDVMDGAQL